MILALQISKSVTTFCGVYKGKALLGVEFPGVSKKYVLKPPVWFFPGIAHSSTLPQVWLTI